MVIIDSEKVKKAWDDLRGRYNAAKKRYKESNKSGAGGGKSPTWQYYEAMSWLDPHMAPSKTATNVPTAPPSSEPEIFESTSQPASIDGSPITIAGKLNIHEFYNIWWCKIAHCILHTFMQRAQLLW